MCWCGARIIEEKTTNEQHAPSRFRFTKDSSSPQFRQRRRKIIRTYTFLGIERSRDPAIFEHQRVWQATGSARYSRSSQLYMDSSPAGGTIPDTSDGFPTGQSKRPFLHTQRPSVLTGRVQRKNRPLSTTTQLPSPFVSLLKFPVGGDHTIKTSRSIGIQSQPLRLHDNCGCLSSTHEDPRYLESLRDWWS
jgi:hypothetical protein